MSKQEQAILKCALKRVLKTDALRGVNYIYDVCEKHDKLDREMLLNRFFRIVNKVLNVQTLDIKTMAEPRKLYRTSNGHYYVVNCLYEASKEEIEQFALVYKNRISWIERFGYMSAAVTE